MVITVPLPSLHIPPTTFSTTGRSDPTMGRRDVPGPHEYDTTRPRKNPRGLESGTTFPRALRRDPAPATSRAPGGWEYDSKPTAPNYTIPLTGRRPARLENRRVYHVSARFEQSNPGPGSYRGVSTPTSVASTATSSVAKLSSMFRSVRNEAKIGACVVHGDMIIHTSPRQRDGHHQARPQQHKRAVCHHAVEEPSMFSSFKSTSHNVLLRPKPPMTASTNKTRPKKT